MSVKYIVPALLISLLAGCASTSNAASTDPVRARVVAELEQARKDGSYPPSEADYVYPNWVKIANPAGVVMTDGNWGSDGSKAATPPAARSTPAAKPAATATAALMTDGHPEFDVAARTVKGGDSAN
jgi:hypothetical protein